MLTGSVRPWAARPMTSCLLARGQRMALWLCGLFQILERRIDIVHTSLYALPPYSQAVRASIRSQGGRIAPNPYVAATF
jgi:hypothetical protein